MSVLSARMMGSHGHHNLPFGCKCSAGNLCSRAPFDLVTADDPNGVHGIGLPNFINQQQPTPTGQPLLNDQENEEMHDFFSTFESEAQSHGHHMSGQYNDDVGGHMNLQIQMPHTYVGHETYVRSPQMEWQSHQMNGFQFSNPMNHMNSQTPTSPFGNHHHVASPAHPMFPMGQSSMQSFQSGWQQNFPHHAVPSGRPDMHFGTDPNFLNSGYAAPDGPVDPDMSLIAYGMAPASSASNTQPNSRPGSNGNTQPSSPVTSKRRKLNVFQTEQLRMTNGSVTNGLPTKQSPPPPTSARKRKSFVKHEQQPITPLSKTPTVRDEDDLADEDAEYEEDIGDEQVRSPSPPAPWPASKARPIQKPPLPPKPSKSRKKSQSSASPAKPKVRRASSSATTVTRTPLTAEQKKANHTNSEQRRRDATARSYADLYDLVPEIQQMGKQSTMKKLEVVVDKVTAIKQQLEQMRAIMGRDPITGQPVPGQLANNQYGGDLGHLSGWQ